MVQITLYSSFNDYFGLGGNCLPTGWTK